MDDPNDGFDVVCTIGRVQFGVSDQTPLEAAMAMIGRHNAPGVYSFPDHGIERGGTVTVVVEFERAE